MTKPFEVGDFEPALSTGDLVSPKMTLRYAHPQRVVLKTNVIYIILDAHVAKINNVMYVHIGALPSLTPIGWFRMTAFRKIENAKDV